jgi:hypothetical protein
VPFISTKIGRIPWQMKLTDEQGQLRYSFLIMDSISWKGPIIADEEKKRRDDYMPQEEGNLGQVRDCLATHWRSGRSVVRWPMRRSMATCASLPREEEYQGRE